MQAFGFLAKLQKIIASGLVAAAVGDQSIAQRDPEGGQTSGTCGDREGVHDSSKNEKCRFNDGRACFQKA